MAYSTNSDLVDEANEKDIVQCVDDAATGLETIDAVESAAADDQHEYHEEAGKMLNRIEKARSDADELINTFLRSRHDIPLNPVPDFVADLSNDLTIHNIYKRRMALDMPEEVKDMKEQALEVLTKVQRGERQISDSPNVQADQIKTNKSSSDRVFDDDTLDKY